MRVKNELISNVLLWTHSHGQARIGQPARTYLQQLFTDKGCCMEGLQGVIDDRQVARESQGNPCWWHTMMMIYNVGVYIYIYMNSSSWHAAGMDFPDPLSPLIPIVCCL